MSKYAALVEHLATTPEALAEVRMTVREIGRLIDGPMPPSAARHQYWHGDRPHVRLLSSAGWTAHLDPEAQEVAFRRAGDAAAAKPGPPAAQGPASGGRGHTDGTERRVRDLADNLVRYVELFTKRQASRRTALFTGPSIYFHKRTLQRLHSVGLDGVLSGRETEFYELLYATLSSWGMHRMGTRGAKLVGFDDFRGSILDNASAIVELRDLSLRELDETSADNVAQRLADLMQALRISGTGTRMIAFSKALHHLLPSLVPPMDREYTLWFFYAPRDLTSGIDDCFADVFRACAKVAAANRHILLGLVSGHDDLSSLVFDSSETKLVDNAIVEYVWTTLGRKPRKSRPASGR